MRRGTSTSGRSSRASACRNPGRRLAYLLGAGIGVAVIVVASRRDASAGYVATVGASLLLAPLLWAHYLVGLLLPAALLADRGRRWGLLLPLLGWLPEPLLPLVALAARAAAAPRGAARS